MGKGSSFVDYLLSVVRFFLIVCTCVIVSILASSSLIYAQTGTDGDDDAESANRSLSNRDFETGSLVPWAKVPATAAGIVTLHTDKNHTPQSGSPSYNAYIELHGDDVFVKQKVTVFPSHNYYLGGFAATSTNTITAKLNRGATFCDSTTVTYSKTSNSERYPLLSCAFTTASNQSAVKIKMGGNASSGWIVTDDFYIVQTPNYTSSYYMSNFDYNYLYNVGCQKGTVAHSGENGVIFLAFGPPRSQSTSGGGQVYGTNPFGPTSFLSTTQIADAAIAFIDGYANCAQPNEHIILALGTNNCGNGSRTNVPSTVDCVPGGGNVSFNHGLAWAGMVRDVQRYIRCDSSCSWEDRVSAAGANDLEPGWNYAQDSRSWVDGYSSLTVQQGRRPYYDFGSCDSCPHSTNQNGPIHFEFTRTDGTIFSWDWSLNDAFYVAYGAVPAEAFPEIYLTSGRNADQWYRLSRYGVLNLGGKITFSGALTQRQACEDTNLDDCTAIKTDNTPGRGWGQLAHFVTLDPLTTSSIPFSSDIRWNIQ